jgi:hypothetical protein
MITNSPSPPKPAPVRVASLMLGGLGNQLFQYAAGRALAQRLGARLVLDCTSRHAEFRPIVLDRFAIDAEIVRNAVGKPHARHLRLPGALGRKMSDAFHDRFPTTYRIDGHRYKVFGEKRSFVYDRRFETLDGSIYLTGYWQSYRYFENVADLVRAEIRFLGTPADANRDWLARIRSANAVSLHVRRGDYLGNKGVSIVCARSYYDSALQHVRRVLDAPQIFVFSDDIAWCRQTFAAPDIAFVDINGPDAAADDLRLMTACRHHIIANSSLSWWGAWLAAHPEQIVVAPTPWFPGTPLNSDLLPPNWITLPRA